MAIDAPLQKGHPAATLPIPLWMAAASRTCEVKSEPPSADDSTFACLPATGPAALNPTIPKAAGARTGVNAAPATAPITQLGGRGGGIV